MKDVKTLDILLDLFLGDTGKGRCVDYLADEYDIIARFNGGNNSGHQVVFDGKALNDYKINED